MDDNKRHTFRNSRKFLNEIYFWTNTIKDWKYLLVKNECKEIIVNQLRWLKERDKIAVYAFVIMPNHMHIIWGMLAMNGKEMPNVSFNKWTSSNFLKDLRTNHTGMLPFFQERTSERSHRFWQRDPLAILMDSKPKIDQKLDYIHYNPLQPQWNQAEFPEDYHWSSAKFYTTGEDEFGFLTHYGERF